MSDKNNESKGTKQPKKYTKEKLLKSAAYKDKRDILNALLEDGSEYTKAEVEKLITAYLKKEVK